MELEADGKIGRRTDGTCTIAEDEFVVMTKHWKVWIRRIPGREPSEGWLQISAALRLRVID